MEEEEIKLSLTDWLAIERTQLANERTFLAYFRTSLALLAGSVTILRLDAFEDIRWLGYLFLVLTPLVLVTGIWRLISVRKAIERRYSLKKKELKRPDARTKKTDSLGGRTRNPNYPIVVTDYCVYPE